MRKMRGKTGDPFLWLGRQSWGPASRLEFDPTSIRSAAPPSPQRSSAPPRTQFAPNQVALRFNLHRVPFVAFKS